MAIRILLIALAALGACSRSSEQPVDQGLARENVAGEDVAGQHEVGPNGGGAQPAVLPAAPVETAGPTVQVTGAVSRYTSLKQCKVVRNGEEEDWSESRCPGFGGWTVQLDYGDLRENVVLSRAGKPPIDLNLSGLSGGAFNSVGETIEWRSTAAGKQAGPAAIILRNSISEDVNQPERLTAYLVVTDLAQGCVIANVRPGSDQNETARALADGPRRPCLEVRS